MKTKKLLYAAVAMTLVAACQPKVQIVPSDKPIIIELNVNINQEIRVRLDKDVEDLISDNPDLF